MAVTIASILKNAGKAESFCFHIINDGNISEESIRGIEALQKIGKFTITWYSMNKQMHHEQRKDTRQDIPMVTNYRLLQSSILNSIDKVIFLDADLIIMGSLAELWETDISDYYIATTPTPCDFQEIKYNKALGIADNSLYCNTGVMLVNLQKWRDENIEKKLLETEKRYRGIYKFYDQCILNAALFEKIRYIDEKWNFRPLLWKNKSLLKRKYPDAFISPKIIHWADPIKPWKDNTVRYANEYYHFAKLTPYFGLLKSQLPPLRKIILHKTITFFTIWKKRIRRVLSETKLIIRKN
jgi:lipopolysaccharide biosynthesis glycosyltransferase